MLTCISVLGRGLNTLGHSALLQFPVWWGYATSFAASFAAACVASLVSLYCAAAARLGEAITGRARMLYSGGSSHSPCSQLDTCRSPSCCC